MAPPASLPALQNAPLIRALEDESEHEQDLVEMEKLFLAEPGEPGHPAARMGREDDLSEKGQSMDSKLMDALADAHDEMDRQRTADRNSQPGASTPSSSASPLLAQTPTTVRTRDMEEAEQQMNEDKWRLYDVRRHDAAFQAFVTTPLNDWVLIGGDGFDGSFAVPSAFSHFDEGCHAWLVDYGHILCEGPNPSVFNEASQVWLTDRADQHASVTRQEQKALDKELSWREILSMGWPAINAFMEAIKKEARSGTTYAPIRKCSMAEARAIRNDPFLRRRILQSRDL